MTCTVSVTDGLPGALIHRAESSLFHVLAAVGDSEFDRFVIGIAEIGVFDPLSIEVECTIAVQGFKRRGTLPEKFALTQIDF